VLVNKEENVPCGNLFPSGMTSAFSALFFDTYDLLSDDEEYLTPENVAETTPG
jgi:hypothetical protein